jgi:hypothetical protein
MFFKPVECNEFIFYGIFVSIGEVSTAMKRFHYKGDMYSFIYSHGLEYMRVGDDERANEFVIGKKLDFLIQEMNRETNTIGSKANNLEITNFVVDIKTELENIREQIQNIE